MKEPLPIKDIQSDDEPDVGKDSVQEYVWPNMYDEAMSMMETSLLVYSLADLRALERKGELTGGDPSVEQKLLDLPVSVQQVFHVYSENAKQLKASFGEDASELYGSAIRSVVTTWSLTGRIPEVVVFDDENSEKELVYGIAINKAMKRITVGFRGSVTTKDAKQDFKQSMMFVPNPVRSESESESSKPKKIGIHQGFHDYLHGARSDESNDKSKAKYDAILEQVAALCPEYPGYRLYVTGHSLGGALATLFAFEVAASTDPRIPKPVTCISIASPKVGNLDFRHAVSDLEKRCLIRCLRVANFADPIASGPETPPCLVAPVFVCCGKRLMYRHVGIALKLHCPQKHNKFVLTYPRSYRWRYAVMLEGFREIQQLIVGTLVCSLICIPGASCVVGSSLFHLHYCKTYMQRLMLYKERLEKHHLNEFYNEKLKTGY